MSLHPRRHALRFRLATAVWLTAVWVLLWGDLTPANVLGGAAVALVTTAVLPMPAIEFHGRVHLPGLLHLARRFIQDITVASFQVAFQALRGQEPHGAVVAVHLRSHSDLYLTLTAELCSLVPGSIVVEAHRLTGTLYVHILDVATVGGVEATRRNVLDVEARVMRALASDAELAEAGLARKGRADRRAPGDRQEVVR